MKVALYYPWVYLTSGAERTILELTGRSCHEWTIFTNLFEPQTTFPGFAQRKVIRLTPVSVKRSLSAVARAGMRLLRQRLPLEGYDALVVVCEGLGDFVVFGAPRIPVVNLCLTPLRIVFDPHYRANYLSDRGWLTRAIVRLGSPGYRWIDRRAWRRYDHAFCISEEVRQRVLRGRLAPSEKLEVSYVGLGLLPENPSYTLERFFLLPGRVMWTKNIELGIRAFQQFVSSRPEFADFRLVIAGIVDDKSRPYLAKLKALAGSDERIEFHVSPSDDELHELYDSCYATLFTAFNEDWGIVPIEGMAFGKPAIATNRGGPRESVQHGVQGFLEEPEVPAFARRMAELASDPERVRQMSRPARERAKLFTWDRLTGRVDGKLEELAELYGRRPADLVSPIPTGTVPVVGRPSTGSSDVAASELGRSE
ncbi:MAG: glycosyltransferase family 4 protein [bacterium]|nr:glycosyltransferase family 4 protein [bacterium]